MLQIEVLKQAKIQAVYREVGCSPDASEVYEIASCQNGLLLILTQVVLLQPLFLRQLQ